MATTDATFYASDVFNDDTMEFRRHGKAIGRTWLLVVGHSSIHFPVPASAEDAWELYDHGTDRCEMNGVAENHPETVEEMAAAWKAWARRVDVTWTAPAD